MPKKPTKKTVPAVAEKAQPFTSVPKVEQAQGTCGVGATPGLNIHRMVEDRVNAILTPRMILACELDNVLRRQNEVRGYRDDLLRRIQNLDMDIATFEAAVKFLRYQLSRE